MYAIRSYYVNNETERSYNDFVNAVCNLYGIGTNKAKMFITYFQDKALIQYRKQGQKTIYYLV